MNIDEESAERRGAVAAWVQRHHLTMPVALDTGDVASAYGVSTIPHVVVVDRAGRVVLVERRVAPDSLRRTIDEALDRALEAPAR
jgi:hypothetical protein